MIKAVAAVVTWVVTRPRPGQPLDPMYQTIVGSIASLFVLVPRGVAAYRSSDTWEVNLVMLFLAWVLSTLVLARGRETDSFALVAKGIGLPSVLFALGAFQGYFGG